MQGYACHSDAHCLAIWSHREMGDWRNMKEAVLIGAGQTGRGFIAPILQANAYHITFIDKNKELIDQLNAEKSYTVHYFGDTKKPIHITGYDAYTTAEEEAVEKLAHSDLITTSVFAGNIKELVGLLRAAAEQCDEKQLRIICCENGVHVKQPLVDANISNSISEGVIFCTTLQPEEKSLALISEDVAELPVDGSVKGMPPDLQGMPLEADFPSLIQRKIYTYNFMSAIVAYLGDYLQYEVYGEAANDTQIMELMDRAVPVVSTIIAKEYAVEQDVQLAFTMRAVHKFRNRDIYDTVYRNARQAQRKLKKEERLYEPLRLAEKFGQKCGYIVLTAAAAMRYAVVKEGNDLDTLMKLYENFHAADKLREVYAMLKEGISLQELIKFCAEF